MAAAYLAIFMGPVYADPVANKWAIFAWYVVSLCLFDTFGTLFDVNAVSLYPDKFKGLNERRTVQGMGTILGIVGLVLAAVIPPMFITTGVALSYRTSALVTFGAGFVFLALMIPGIFETRQVPRFTACAARTWRAWKSSRAFSSQPAPCSPTSVS